MTENELRQFVVDVACSYLGYNEHDGSHRKLIDLYNSHLPRARGYAVQYNDEWCATFVSAVSIACGLTDIMPTECGCEKMIELYKKLGRWIERDDYVPKPADIVFYDWQDSGVGDNTGYSDHVGIVVGVQGNTITTIEGNVSDKVDYRTIQLNGRYIRGFAIPDYASKADPVDIGRVSDYARESCVKAVTKGIVHGYGDGEYGWHDPVTREQFIVMLDRMGLL